MPKNRNENFSPPEKQLKLGITLRVVEKERKLLDNEHLKVINLNSKEDCLDYFNALIEKFPQDSLTRGFLMLEKLSMEMFSRSLSINQYLKILIRVEAKIGEEINFQKNGKEMIRVARDYSLSPTIPELRLICKAVSDTAVLGSILKEFDRGRTIGSWKDEDLYYLLKKFHVEFVGNADDLIAVMKKMNEFKLKGARLMVLLKGSKLVDIGTALDELKKIGQVNADFVDNMANLALNLRLPIHEIVYRYVKLLNEGVEKGNMALFRKIMLMWKADVEAYLLAVKSIPYDKEFLMALYAEKPGKKTLDAILKVYSRVYKLPYIAKMNASEKLGFVLWLEKACDHKVPLMMEVVVVAQLGNYNTNDLLVILSMAEYEPSMIGKAAAYYKAVDAVDHQCVSGWWLVEKDSAKVLNFMNNARGLPFDGIDIPYTYLFFPDVRGTAELRVLVDKVNNVAQEKKLSFLQATAFVLRERDAGYKKALLSIEDKIIEEQVRLLGLECSEYGLMLAKLVLAGSGVRKVPMIRTYLESMSDNGFLQPRSGHFFDIALIKSFGVKEPATLIYALNIMDDSGDQSDLIDFMQKVKSYGKVEDFVIGLMLNNFRKYRKYVGEMLRVFSAVFARTIAFDKDNLQAFLTDPALMHVLNLLKKFPALDPKQALIIGRNFFMGGVSLEKLKRFTLPKILQMWKKVERVMERVGDVDLMKDRHVLVLKEKEWEKGGDRFMPVNTVDAVKQSIGRDSDKKLDICDTGRFFDGQKQREAVGRDFLSKIVVKPPPCTFLALAHCGSYGFDQFGINPKNLAIALRKRVEYWLDYGKKNNCLAKIKDDLRKDIFIGHSCFFHDVARKVVKLNKGYIKPIIIAMAEYGGYSYSDPGKKNPLFALFGVGSKGRKMRDLFNAKAAGAYTTSDVSVFVDDEDGFTVQLTEADKGKRKRG